MLAPLTITKRISESKLVEASKTEKNSKVTKRILAILGVKRGDYIPAVAKQLCLSESRLRSWVHRFNAEGLKGLVDKKRSGKPKKLSSKEEEKFRARIMNGALKKDSVNTLRGKDFQKILLQEFGKSYSLAGAYVILHRLGYSNIVPRPKNPRTNNIKQGIFKKKLYAEPL